ncbi:MAG TPA: hypothetical protein VG186_08935 [Solirubrobacteraceae bacterium]|jgi:hypothetical protein|nr:hypothetical protein [Solirubrobacteraceae bacterium]
MAEAQRALEASAQRIAEQGREALLHRLRGAFEEAAAAHADVLELDEKRLERMVTDAADRADGLQWRRALASVATEELGTSLGEALGHPAVARAQEIVGAPSYEEGLAAIAEGKAPAPGGGRAPGTSSKTETETETAAETETETDREGKAAPAPAAESEPAAEAAPAAESEPGRLPVSVTVVHLDGLAELEGHGDLELVFSADGLEVLPAGEGDRATLASFTWSELRGVEVQPGRGRVLRRRSSRLTLSTNRRRARFEARGAEPAELKERLAPALAKLGSGE